MLYSGIFIRAACCVLSAACSVLRAACKCESNKGIHSFNFSSVLRAACKYELAFTVGTVRYSKYFTEIYRIYNLNFLNLK